MIRRRKPIARSITPIDRGGRPKGISTKRRERQPERTAVVDAAWERDGGRCQARLYVPSVRCAGQLDPHEIIPRSAWAAGAYVLDNVLMVCRAHHDWIGDNPKLAHEAGLHGFSWEIYWPRRRLRVVE